MIRNSLFYFFVLSVLSIPFFVFSVGSLGLIEPTNGASDIEVDAYFQWKEVSNAQTYVLDISGLTIQEDNIHPRPGGIVCGNIDGDGKPKCEAGENINNCPVDCSSGDSPENSLDNSVCSGGICTFGFLVLSIGDVDYSDSYTWRIIAYDVKESLIATSPSWTFTTEQPPTQTIFPPGSDPDPGPGPVNPPTSNIFQIENPISSNTLPELITKLLNFVFGLAIVIAPLIVLYAGFLMLTAAGDATKLQKARTILIWTVIAFAIILVAKGTPNVIRSIL